nr:hypothetical protein [Tanacetum cinerariifolium]
TSTKVKTVNEDVRLQALVDRKKVIVNEASIRRDLRLDDAEGTACLLNAVIFEELARIGAKTTVWNEFGSTMASTIICLANNQKFNFSKYIFKSMIKKLEVRVKFLMYLRFVQVFLNNQLGDMSHYKGIFINPSLTKNVFANMKRVGTGFSGAITPSFETMMVQAPKEVEESQEAREKKKLRTSGLKRLYKVGLSARIFSSDEEGLGDQEDASKQGRIAKIDTDEDISLINETIQDQGRMNEEDLFRVNDLDGDEVIVDVTTRENVEQDTIVAEKEVSTTDDEVVTTIEDLEGTTTATTLQISNDDVTLAQTLIEIKAAKPKARGAKDKGKGIIVKPEKPLKKKDQIALDEEVARNLEAQMKAEMEKEERIAREKDVLTYK